MKKLILITVFVLLGTLVNSVMAAKPVHKATLITLSAGPVDEVTTCKVANQTDQAIDVFMNICQAANDNSGPIDCRDIGPGFDQDSSFPAPASSVLLPGHYEPPEFAIAFVRVTRNCEITYLGYPGDITGTMCGTVSGNFTCFQMQPR